MIVFPLVSAPLFGFLMASVSQISMEDLKKQGRLFAKGFLSYIPTFLLILLLRRILADSYRPAYLYFRSFLAEHFLGFVVVAGAFVLFQGFTRLFRTEALDFISFGAGYYTLSALQTVLENHRIMSEYILFILPLLRIVTILLTAVLLVKLVNGFGLFRGLYALCLLAIPFLVSLFSFLYHINHLTLTVVLTGFMLPVAFILWFILRE